MPNKQKIDQAIKEVHLRIEKGKDPALNLNECDLTEIPQTKKGNPIPGKFEFSEEFITPVTEHEFEKSLDELECDAVSIAAHAVVFNTVTGEEETAWADTQGLLFPGKNWAMYFIHELT